MARKDPSPNERYNTTDCVRGTQRKTGRPSRANKALCWARRAQDLAVAAREGAPDQA